MVVALTRLFLLNDFNYIKKLWYVLLLLALWSLFIILTSNKAESESIISKAIEESTPITPKEYLRTYAGSNFDLINRIIIAESGWHINAKNKASTASGLGQYLDSTFKSQCINKYKLTDSMLKKNDPYIQIDCMILMIQNNGQSHWNASKHNWK